MNQRSRLEKLESKMDAKETHRMSDPEWIKLRTLILTVLDKYPEAKRQLIKVLIEAGA